MVCTYHFKHFAAKEDRMSTNPDDRSQPIPLWRARAWLGGGNWTDAAYGFGGPDVPEAVGTPEEVGTELTNFLDGMGGEEVQAERLRTGHFYVRLEVEPGTGGSTLADRREETLAEIRIPCWEARACVGNGRGVFDGCYSFGNPAGDEAHLLGTAQELGAELTRVLQLLTRADVEDMKYDTDRFLIELVIVLPEPPASVAAPDSPA
jgi:hypothetical protein